MKEKKELIDLLNKIKSEIFNCKCLKVEYFLRWVDDYDNSKDWYKMLIENVDRNMNEWIEMLNVLEDKLIFMDYDSDDDY